jgi:hypothetical protein
MNDIRHNHPAEEALISFALGETCDEGVREHIVSCPACSREVKELHAVHAAILSLPDEAVPQRFHNALLKNLRTSRWPLDGQWWISPVYFLKNPLFFILGTICVIIFLYLFYIFVL